MTPTNPTEAQMKLARELMTKAAPMFPITTHNGPDYADVTFAEDHSSQAMTMEPDTWNALNELFVSLPAIFDAIQATEARAQGLVDALNGYKAAVAFVAADAWDGCSDCIDVLKAARCADTVESLTPDEIAANLKRIRLHFQPPAKHSQHGGERER